MITSIATAPSSLFSMAENNGKAGRIYAVRTCDEVCECSCIVYFTGAVDCCYSCVGMFCYALALFTVCSLLVSLTGCCELLVCLSTFSLVFLRYFFSHVADYCLFVVSFNGCMLHIDLIQNSKDDY